jgi:hypothetical protein
VAEIESSDLVRVEAAPKAAANVEVGATTASTAGVCSAGVEAGGTLAVDLGAVDDGEADLCPTGFPTSGDDRADC